MIGESCKSDKGEWIVDMFRMWIKLWDRNKMKQDTVIEIDNDDTRTHKVFQALEQACYHFDLSVPIWLDKNIEEFQRVSKTRFYGDSFMEDIPFDAMEVQIIEE